MKVDIGGSHTAIRRIFSADVALSAEEQEALTEKWSHIGQLSRNDFLVAKGQTETRLFYVAGGTLRIYYPHGDEEVCVGFAYEGNLICSYPSFILAQTSDYSIQALSKTTVVSIMRSDFYSLLDAHRNIERAWRILQEKALIGKIERETEMLTFTPEERYERLLKRSPHVFQLIPRKYIASYLRMTPETLSRLGSRS